MKRLKILIVLLLVVTAYGAHSQTSDTTCLPNTQLKQALKLIEQGKVDRIELEQVKGQQVQLQEIVKGKDERIVNLQQQVTTGDVMNANLTTQNNLKDQTIASLNKALKKQKTKTVLAGISAVLISGAVIFLSH